MVGSKWDDWKDQLHYLDYAVLAAIVALIVYALWQAQARPRSTPGDAEEHPFMKPSRAIVLGAVQGPTELLPVSSSAHLTLIPWLLGWRREDGDAELDKTFGVALHAGAAAALLVGQRQVILEELRTFDRAQGRRPRSLVPARRRSSAFSSSG